MSDTVEVPTLEPLIIAAVQLLDRLCETLAHDTTEATTMEHQVVAVAILGLAVELKARRNGIDAAAIEHLGDVAGVAFAKYILPELQKAPLPLK